MSPPETSAPGAEKFDSYAASYDSLHQQSVAASGEPTEYFALYKIACLERIGASKSAPVLDFGCGIGNLTEPLAQSFGDVHGFDPSAKSLEVAQRRAPSAHLHATTDAIPDDHFAIVVLSGVLHHVPPHERPALVRTVRKKLRPGGRVVIFEHNPFNPLTRKAVADCPFDDDAVLLWPWELTGLLRDAGLHDIEREFIVFFPRALSFLRAVEPRLKRLFLGAQTMTIGARR
jgi:2-polyprenyl-3-methyl-5-hydroxy-6-metoxy-1,4-benzoquinol methylase